MTTHDDKVKALLAEAKAGLIARGAYKAGSSVSLLDTALMKAVAAFDPPQPEAPERVWLYQHTDGSWRLHDSSNDFHKTAKSYIPEATAIKRKAGGVEGWFWYSNDQDCYSLCNTREQAFSFASDCGGRAVHLVETE